MQLGYGAVHQKAPEPVLAKIKYPAMLVLPDTREGTFELTLTWCGCLVMTGEMNHLIDCLL